MSDLRCFIDKNRSSSMLSGFLFFVVGLLILTNNSFALKMENDGNFNPMVYELNKAEKISEEIREFISNSIFVRGSRNQGVVDDIAKILIEKYNFEEDEIVVILFGDLNGIPTHLVVIFKMVFNIYEYDYSNLNVGEKL